MKKVVSLILGVLLSLNLFAESTGTDGAGKLYNTAYFDITLKSQGPMLDYIKYSKRASFDVKFFLETLNKIQERDIVAKIHGRIEVPSDITTPQVYVSVGANYLNNEYNWFRKIFYNGSKNFQNAEYFLVDTKKDKFGNGYIDYSIIIEMQRPYDIKADWKSVPAGNVFSIAPNGRGFKNKFQSTEIYVFEE